MDDKSKLELLDKLKVERDVSDGRYAFKEIFNLVKIIVFTMVSIILTTALAKMLSVIMK